MSSTESSHSKTAISLENKKGTRGRRSVSLDNIKETTMKILLTGYKNALMKECATNLKSKFSITVQDEKKLDEFEKVRELFAKNQFDVVVFFAMGHSALEFFRSVQYSSIVGGVKKILLISDPEDFDLAHDIEDAGDDDHSLEVPTQKGGLEKYLLSLLASKDKLTTTLRVFSLFGNGSAEELSKAVSKARKSKKIILERDKELSLIFIEDAVKIIEEFIKNDFEKGFYNVAPDYSTSYSEVLKKTKTFLKKEGVEVATGFKSLESAPTLVANSEKLISAIGENFKFTSLTSAVNKMLRV